MIFQTDSEASAATAIPAMKYYSNQMNIVKSLALPPSIPESLSRPIRVLFTTSADFSDNELYAECLKGNFLAVKSGLAPPVEIHVADNGRFFNPLWNDASELKPPPLERQKKLIEVEKDKICNNYDVVIVYIGNQLNKDHPERLKSLTDSLTQNQVFIGMTEFPKHASSRLRYLRNLFFHLGGFYFNPLKSMKSKWWLFCKHERCRLADIIRWACIQYLLLKRVAY